MENCFGNSSKISSPERGFFSLGARNFVFFVKMFLEMFRWTLRMPSWQTRSLCVHYKFFAKKSRKKYKMNSYATTFFKMVSGHVDFNFDIPGELLRKKRTILFHCNSENEFKVLFFSSTETSFFSKGFSCHVECVFGKSVIPFSPDNRSIFNQIQKGYKV